MTPRDIDRVRKEIANARPDNISPPAPRGPADANLRSLTMPTVYEKADKPVTDMLAKVMKQYHGELVAVETRVGVLMAHNPDGPAVKLHGVPCFAVVRIRNLKDRAHGMADAEIIIDASRWEDLSVPEREAILDHEAQHLVLQRDKETRAPKTDDLGRPKLKMRPHDVEHGFFHTIAQRHGDNSQEVQQAKAFADDHGQLYWGWNRPPDQGVESMPAKTPEDAALKLVKV